MMKTSDTIQIFVPLKLRKKNGRPKILPPAGYLPSEDQTQDPHILRAIGRAWSWRRRMEAGEFGTVRDLAIALKLSERQVSRQMRLAWLAPAVLKRLVYRERHEHPVLRSGYSLARLAVCWARSATGWAWTTLMPDFKAGMKTVIIAG